MEQDQQNKQKVRVLDKEGSKMRGIIKKVWLTWVE